MSDIFIFINLLLEKPGLKDAYFCAIISPPEGINKSFMRKKENVFNVVWTLQFLKYILSTTKNRL